MDKAFEKLLFRLGKDFSEKILSAKIDPEKIREIRLTVNNPVQLITDEKAFFTDSKRLSLGDIQDIFASLCEYSVHTYKNEICEGFITAEGGFRVGICGTAVYEEDKIIGIKDISSLNIRIPHEIFGSANKIIPYAEHGMLIIGPPCSGKTTVLRDLARQISKNHRVTIADERMEIAGVYRGLPSFDIGSSSVLNGFLKSDGIKIAACSMAPDIIVCDEFGDEKDLSAALYAMKSGVNITASIHAFDMDDLLTKPFIPEIIKSEIFKHFAFLNKKCEIYKITDLKEMNT